MGYNELKKHLENVFFSNKKSLMEYTAFNQEDWNKILDFQPLKHAIEEKFSGVDISTSKCLENLELASYFSVALTLMFGINIALFLEPIEKYGSDNLKKKVLTDFLAEKKSGGLMITEPSFGSDALNMETTFTIKDDKVKIKGTKHWQGLTGQADYWLVAGREVVNNIPSKQISFCIVPQSQVKYDLFDTQGLKPIQYGVNHLDTEVPVDNLLIHKTNDNAMISDILHRSRMQFAGMGAGITRRILDNVVEITSNRAIRGKKIINMPEVKKSIIDLQTYHTLVKGCYLYSSKHSGVEYDLENDAIIANSIKVTVTEMMRSSSDLGIQLSGGNGFLESNFAFHSLRDARPFLIFEGPNSMLSNQVLRLTLLGMKKQGYTSVFDYYSNINKDNTVLNNDYKEFDFSLDELMLRDVEKREAVASTLINIINTMFLEELKQTDYNTYMIDNAITYVKNTMLKNKAVIKSDTAYSALQLV